MWWVATLVSTLRSAYSGLLMIMEGMKICVHTECWRWHKCFYAWTCIARYPHLKIRSTNYTMLLCLELKSVLLQTGIPYCNSNPLSWNWLHQSPFLDTVVTWSLPLTHRRVRRLWGNTLPTPVGVGHQWTESTSIGCNQWLSLAKIALKVPPAGRNRSLVASTNRCGEGISFKPCRLSMRKGA